VIVVLYNVSGLLHEPVGSTRLFSIAEPVALPFAGAPVVHLVGDLTLLRTPAGVLARATLVGTMPAECSRCLSHLTLPLRLTIEDEFLPTVDVVSGARLPAPAEPTPFRIDAHHHLDLSEAVRQAAVLAEPLAPLCRPDCRGLCPHCGVDRNTTACACATGPVDERWVRLRDLT
jgi:uncharacterized protein